MMMCSSKGTPLLFGRAGSGYLAIVLAAVVMRRRGSRTAARKGVQRLGTVVLGVLVPGPGELPPWAASGTSSSRSRRRVTGRGARRRCRLCAPLGRRRRRSLRRALGMRAPLLTRPCSACLLPCSAACRRISCCGLTCGGRGTSSASTTAAHPAAARRRSRWWRALERLGGRSAGAPRR